MYRPVTLLSVSFCALSTFTSHFVRARPCVAFDIQWNLLAFGFDGKDFSAGTQDTWASGEYTNPLTRSRRLMASRKHHGHHNLRSPVSTRFRAQPPLVSDPPETPRPFDGANTTCYLSQVGYAVLAIIRIILRVAVRLQQSPSLPLCESSVPMRGARYIEHGNLF